MGLFASCTTCKAATELRTSQYHSSRTLSSLVSLSLSTLPLVLLLGSTTGSIQRVHSVSSTTTTFTGRSCLTIYNHYHRVLPQMPWYRESSHLFASRRHFSSSTTTTSALYSTNINLPTELEDHIDGISNLPRLYVESPTLKGQTLLSLTPYQSNYLQVMRISKTKRWGALAGHVRVFNGIDGEWIAKVLVTDDVGSSGKRSRKSKGSSSDSASVLECLHLWKEQPSQQEQDQQSLIQLYIGRLKKTRRKWVLEKATEVGVNAIEAVDTEWSTRTDAWDYEKHHLQIVEAAEQCERLTLPRLGTEPQTWEGLKASIQASADDESGDRQQHWFICRERSTESLPLPQALASTQSDVGEKTAANTYNILVGPEGGWSVEELEDMEGLRATQGNIHFVSLGPLVLRAETAAIAALSTAMLFRESQ